LSDVAEHRSLGLLAEYGKSDHASTPSEEESALFELNTRAFFIKNKLSGVMKGGLNLVDQVGALKEMNDDEMHESGLSVVEQTR
jgi:hypothetical protein